ncbi:hypothetical protein SISSUDRAFT_1120153 [Sistotremastrum suecicum HHB10207 ss-3]|uniref:F-box domain-containing protein n=1 Tax=Sistotremastrum suecicum HHB10207 ss-3 TaxID=1314776 RepID=A0A166CQY6_9AGAM|nr:hypothetical protein SISSUDRAFT_1120153 [Sistotremastrum suecicum HHB10207 ss-3]
MFLIPIPTEIMHEILTLSLDEDMPTAKSRLQASMRLGLINRRIRAAALSCHELWSTIYLQWPQEVVALYLQRSQAARQNPALSVYLDTNGKQTEDIRIDADLWASFLKQNMEVTKHLNVVIHNGHNSPALSHAFNSPAPVLRSCTLTVGSKIRLPITLFARRVPQLRDARFRSTTHYDFGPSTSLQVLNLKIDQENARGFLNMLESSPDIHKLTLVGQQNPTPISLRQRKPIILSSCRVLTVEDMLSVSARHLLSLLRLPTLDRLEFHEKHELNERVAPITLASALKALRDNTLLPARSISIHFYPNRAIISADGVPHYHHVTDWPDPPYILPVFPGPLSPQRIFATLAEMLTSPASNLHMQPLQLAIHNNINGQAPRTRVLSSALETEMQPLLLHVFQTYHSIQGLQLLGHVEDAIRVILGAPHILPQLSSIQIDSDSSLVSPEILLMLQSMCNRRNISLQ